MKPDAAKRNPDPDYLRGLIARTGLTQAQVADAIGLSPRQMRMYLSTNPAARQDAPYAVQFALEALSAAAPRGRA